MSGQKIVKERRVVAGEVVEVRRSARRRRSVQAYRDGEQIVVLLPATLNSAEQDEWATRMVERVLEQEKRRERSRPRSDDALEARAQALSREYLDGQAQPAAIRWVTNQNSRWGSCTPSTRQIRLSHRLQSMPSWVIDAVIVHELTHLLVPGHGPRFHQLAGRYPLTEKANGFLEGVAHAAGITAAWDDDIDQ